MAQKVKLLVTGATGYIGGAIVSRFLARPDASLFDIRAIVRSREKGEKLKEFGITPIIGSHNDENVMVKAASEVDVAITMADCDDLDAAKYALKGLKRRFEETGKPPILIHTSGTGVLSDDAAGMHITETIYNDADSGQIATLAPTQVHRNVDLEILAADKEGYIKSYIILPSTIYSIAEGPLFTAGISNSHSAQIPAIVRASLDRKRAGMVGGGHNLWPNVNVHELADLYSILYDTIINNPGKAGHGHDGFYFGASGEHKLYDVSKAVGDALVELGVADNAEPTTFTSEEIDKYFSGSNYLGSNSRCIANRARALGWNPKKSTADMLKSIKPEVNHWYKS